MEKSEFKLNTNSALYTVGRSQRGKPQVIYKGQTYSIHYTRTKRQSRLVCGCTRSIIGMKRCCPAYIIITTSPNGLENVQEKRQHMCNASTMPEDQHYTITTTNKNKPSILHQGYTYALMYKTDIAAVYLCTKPKKDRKLRCKARCIINTINGVERLRLENTHECQKRGDTHKYEEVINTVALNIQEPFEVYVPKEEIETIHYGTIPASGAIIHLDEAAAEGTSSKFVFISILGKKILNVFLSNSSL